MVDNKHSLNNQIFIKIHKIFMKIYFKIRYQNKLIDSKISLTKSITIINYNYNYMYTPPYIYGKASLMNAFFYSLDTGY